FRLRRGAIFRRVRGLVLLRLPSLLLALRHAGGLWIRLWLRLAVLPLRLRLQLVLRPVLLRPVLLRGELLRSVLLPAVRVPALHLHWRSGHLQSPSRLRRRLVHRPRARWRRELRRLVGIQELLRRGAVGHG